MTTPLTGQGSWFCIPLTGAALFAGGEIGSAINPEGANLIIKQAVVYIETDTSAAGTTLGVGTGATAATAATDIIAALAIDGSPSTAFNLLAADDAKEALVVWHAADYVTATGSAASTAFVGKLYIKYVHA